MKDHPKASEIIRELVSTIENGYFDPAKFKPGTIGYVAGREWLLEAQQYLASKEECKQRKAVQP